MSEVPYDDSPPDPPKLPDIVDLAEQPYTPPPVPDDGPTMSAIDPADVQPLPVEEAQLPAPVDDLPTAEEMRAMELEEVPDPF